MKKINSKQKGKRYELHTVQQVRQVWPSAKRGIGQARAANEVPDVDGTPLWIEAKNRRSVNIHGAYKKAHNEMCEYNAAHEKKFAYTVVISHIHKTDKNTAMDVVTLPLNEWLDLMQELELRRG